MSTSMNKCPECGAISPDHERPFECDNCEQFFPEINGLSANGGAA